MLAIIRVCLFRKGGHSMNRLLWEVFSDRFYVIITAAAAIAIIAYLWAKFRDKSRSRYKS
jgi:hypothetical protein